MSETSVTSEPIPKKGIDPDLRKKVVDSKQKRRELAHLEKTRKIWSVHGGDVKSYNESFYGLLGNLDYSRSFQGYLTKRKETGKGTFVMDVLGDGAFLRSLPGIDGGIAICLTDNRDNKQKLDDQEKKIDVVAGDVTNVSTWMKVSDILGRRGLKTVDVIVSRGVGGVDFVPSEYYKFLTGKLWSKLSSDNGVLITQIPRKMQEQARRWGEEVRRRGEANFYYQEARSLFQYEEHSYPAMALVKNKDSVLSFPVVETAKAA